MIVLPTPQDIKDDLETEFLPFPVIEQDHIDLAVKDALRKWSAEQGLIKTSEESYSEQIDLSHLTETVVNVSDVIPSQNELIEFATVTENSHLLTEAITHPRGGDSISPDNTLTNWVQKLDLWSQIKSFLDHDPNFYYDDEEETLYLDNYPSGMSTVLVVMEVEVPTDPVDDSYKITDTEAFDWMMEYARGRMLKLQGRIYRVETQGTPDAGGTEMFNEGKDIMQKKEDELDNMRNLVL